MIPPPADPTMPMLGPFVLADFLKKKGMSVHVYDTSIAFFKNALDTHCIRRCGANIGASIILIEDAIKMADSFQGGTYDKMQSMLTAACILSSLQNTIQFSLDEIRYTYGIYSITQLKQAVTDLAWTIPLFEHQAYWEDILKSTVQYIGISVAYTAQLPFALCMAQQIKQYRPKTAIFLGGSYFENYEIAPSAILRDFPFIDQIIIGAGEMPLFTLFKNISIERAIIRSDNQRYNLLPDFSDVKWDDYCVDGNIRAAPFSFRTRCYYGKCAFCFGDNQMPPHSLSPQQLQETVLQLKNICKRQKITHVYFADAALPPFLMKILAEAVSGDFYWAINARIEKGLEPNFFSKLFSNGCRMLRVGMESASQKVLDLMHKGHNVNYYADFFTAAYKTGIKLHVYIMFGFPGEEESDRELTLQFLQDHLGQVYSYTISIFHAIPGTTIFNDLARQYHLNPLQPEQDVNLCLYDEQRYKTMLEWVQRTSSVLASAHTNQFCYGGRVFMDSPDLDTAQAKQNVLQNNNYASAEE